MYFGILLIILLFPFGIVSLINPSYIALSLMRFFKFFFYQVTMEKLLTPRNRKMFELLESSPQKFTEKYPLLLIEVRIGGIIGICMALGLTCMLVATMSN
jgi:hypothetical protein